MKKLLLLLSLIISTNLFAQDTCSIYGDNISKTKSGIQHRHIDSCKNRKHEPEKYVITTFDEIADLKVTDSRTWNEGVTVEGWITDIKDGGKESCNCHSSVYKDTHVYLSKTEDGKSQDAIIVEVTPWFRAKLGSTRELKEKYLHKKVKVSGWLFKDDEHKTNSTIDGGLGNLWRHTTWEIHPITNIELVN